MVYPNLRFSPLSTQEAGRFWRKVDAQNFTACWPWKAAMFKENYGAFGLRSKNYRANRVAYFLYYGQDPAELMVCHRCDNPPCCNPFHLFLGTVQDNAMDAKRKGRLATGDRSGARLHPDRWQRGDDHWTRRMPDMVKGERNGRAALKESDVEQILTAYRANPKRGTTRKLSAAFGVDITSIQRIVKGKQWKHVYDRLQNE